MIVRPISLIVLLTGLALTAAGQDPVHVIVNRTAQPAGELVTLAEVAQVTGGDLITRRNIAQLDILKLASEPVTRNVSKQQIEVRILLAGIPASQFQVSGSDSVVVRAANSEAMEQRILAFLLPDIANRLDVDPDDVQLTLARPLPDEAEQLFGVETRLEHFLRRTVRPGTLYVKLAAYEGDRILRTAGVWLDVQVARPVFVATRTLPVGTQVTAADVNEQRQVTSEQIARNIATDVVGQQTSKQIEAGEVITRQDLGGSRRAKREIVIRSRDVVELIVRKNALQVKINGAVALQSGASGEVIRVKNPRSGKVLTAKVVDGGTVEIRL